MDNKDFKIKLELDEDSSNPKNNMDNLLKEVNDIFDKSLQESSINQTQGLLAFSIVSHIIINTLNKN